jgi:flavin reductase (DIM6/NTAB) family NADH-FMN oxidoreductase RutF
MGDDTGGELIRTAEISARERYQLLISLVVPRPIGWLSTFSADGEPNLAPFSYFAALADTPMLVGASIGQRGAAPKDTLRNIRETRAFCVNVVTESQLDAMNLTSGDFPAGVDEFQVAGLPMARALLVNAPYVGNCPAVLECRLHQEVDLGSPSSTLVIAEVVAVHLDPKLERATGTQYVTTESLRPVGRLASRAYALIGEIKKLDRPKVD